MWILGVVYTGKRFGIKHDLGVSGLTYIFNIVYIVRLLIVSRFYQLKVS
jgi:hypothetical protein